LKQITDASRSGIAQTDATGRIAYANTRLLEIFSVRSVAELTSMEAVFEADGDDCVGLSALFRVLAAQPEQDREIYYYADGARRCLQGHASELTISDRPDTYGTVFHITDVTENVHKDFRDRYYAKHDGLTGAYNRVAFWQDLDDAASLVRPDRFVALLAIDLDRFKPINDTHGHAAGDVVLKTVVSRLEACVGPGASVYRLGGDEFMVITMIGSADDAAATASEMLSRLAQPIALQDGEVCVSASIGIAITPGDTDSVRDLVNLADRALYHAKDEGRGQFRFYENRPRQAPSSPGT